MVENEKKQGIMDMLKDSLKEGLSTISNIIISSITPPIVDGAATIMKNMEEKIIKIEKRILRKLYTFLIIGCGVIFLILAFFFFLTEYLEWSNAIAFFSLGIIVFVTGLLIQIGGSNK
ncbi:MAG: hypothetical protein ACP5N1_04585 [Candidatus Woesearchaeota archaeon]